MTDDHLTDQLMRSNLGETWVNRLKQGNEPMTTIMRWQRTKTLRGRTILIASICCYLSLPILPGVVPAWAQDSKTKQPGIGQRAPDFELPIVGENKFLRLRDQYQDGPVVVIVLRGYPGYQCPVCKSQVNSLINRARTLASEANRVILVYPGKAEQLERRSKQLLGSRKLPKPIVLVRDEDMQMVESWGLRWQARNETAYPATFVIDQNGRVAWKKVSNSHAGRSSGEEILKELRKL